MTRCETNGPYAMSNSQAIIRKREVVRRTGYSYSTIIGLERAQQFPQCVQLNERAVVWYDDEVNQWVRNRVRGRGGSLAEQQIKA